MQKKQKKAAKVHKRMIVLLLFVLGMAPTLVSAQQTDSTTVHRFSAEEAVQYALNHSIQVKNALLAIRAQKQTNKEITARALPQISASGSINYNPEVAVQTFPNFIAASTYAVLVENNVQKGNGDPITMPEDFGTINAAFGSKFSLNAGVDITQILFDGQVFVGLMARDASIKNAQLSAEITKEDIEANVLKIYYQLLVGQQQIGTFDANIANYVQLLHDTRIIYENGFAEKLDVDKVRVQLVNLQTQRLKADNQIRAGLEGLKFLMNLPMQDSLVLTDALTMEELKSNILSEDFDFEDRPDYRKMQTLMDLGQYNVKRYQLSKLPTLTLTGNYSKSAQRQEFNFFEGPYFTSSFLALRLSVPIFSGFAKNAQIENARISLQQTKNSLQQLESSIVNEVTQSRINMKTALFNMDTQSENIELAEQVYESTKLKYEQGVGSNQEISTAQADLVTAQNNYYSSLYDAIIAKINYLKATGKL